MGVGKSLHTEIIDKQEKKMTKQRKSRLQSERGDVKLRQNRMLLSILNTMNDKLKTRTGQRRGERGGEDSLCDKFYIYLD